MVRLHRHDEPRAQKLVFPSGFSLAVREDGRQPVAAVRLYVRGGSLAEGPDAGRGIAHLLEHVAATKMAEELDRRGDAALFRAFTAREHTCYGWRVLKQECTASLRHAFGALGRLRSNPLAAEATFTAQKSVVAEEISLFLDQALPDLQQRLRYPVCGWPDRLEGVTLQDLEDYLRRIYVAPNMTLAVVGDVDSGEIIEAVAQIDRDLPQGTAFALCQLAVPPKPVPALPEESWTLDEWAARLGQEEFPPDKPEPPRSASRHPWRKMLHKKLENGASLVVIPTSDPRICCQVMARGGLLLEPRGAEGVAALMSDLLPRAYRDRTGARLLPFSDESFTGISLMADAADLLPGLRLLAEMSLRPSFRPEDLERCRIALLSWHQRARRPWMEETRRSLKHLLYRRHPYGRDEAGTVTSLRGLTLDAIERSHRRMFVAGGMAVVVAGKVDPEAVLAELEALFSSASTEAGVRSPPAEPPRRLPKRSESEGSWRHGALALGYSGAAWSPSTWPALEIVQSLLVGPGSSSATGRLQHSLRSKGTSYKVQFLNQSGFGEGYLAFLATFAPGKEKAVARPLETELARLRAGDLSAGEMEQCRRLALLHHLLLADSSRALSYSAGRHVLLSAEAGGWEHYTSALRSVTIEDVAAVSRRVFRKEAEALTVFVPDLAAPGIFPSPVSPEIVYGGAS